MLQCSIKWYYAFWWFGQWNPTINRWDPGPPPLLTSFRISTLDLIVILCMLKERFNANLFNTLQLFRYRMSLLVFVRWREEDKLQAMIEQIFQYRMFLLSIVRWQEEDKLGVRLQCISDLSNIGCPCCVFVTLTRRGQASVVISSGLGRALPEFFGPFFHHVCVPYILTSIPCYDAVSGWV